MVPYVTNNLANTLAYREYGYLWEYVVTMFLEPSSPPKAEIRSLTKTEVRRINSLRTFSFTAQTPPITPFQSDVSSNGAASCAAADAR